MVVQRRAPPACGRAPGQVWRSRAAGGGRRAAVSPVRAPAAPARESQHAAAAASAPRASLAPRPRHSPLAAARRDELVPATVRTAAAAAAASTTPNRFDLGNLNLSGSLLQTGFKNLGVNRFDGDGDVMSDVSR